MEQPLINILIRTSSRPNAFRRCLKSIVSQSYPNIRIIIGYDNEKALDYIPKGLETYFVSADHSLPFFYDAYIPQLLDFVTEGYAYILDDSEVLMPDVLQKVVLDAPVVLVQLQRGDIIVPKSADIKIGMVGFPCVFVHYTLKNAAYISPYGVGDSLWIKELQKQVGLKFQEIIVAYSQYRDFGKMEV